MSVELVAALGIAAGQGLLGALVWQGVRRGRASPSEAIGMGLALGSGASALTGVVLWGVLPLAAATTAPLMLAAAASAAALWRLGRWGRLPGRHEVIALGIGIVAGLAALSYALRSYPLQWSGTVMTYHPDMAFFEALSTSLAVYGPNDSIFMAGADIRYHWLAYAWTGQLTALSGAPPFGALTIVLPITALVACVFIAAAWTARLTPVSWAPSLATLLVVTGGYVGATYGTILNVDSPSQALSSAWLLAFTFALWQATRRSLRSRPWSIAVMMTVIGTLSSATTLGKASSGVIGVTAALAIALGGSATRAAWASRAWLSFTAAALGAAWVLVDYVLGSTGGGGLGLGSLLDKASSVQGLNPTDSPVGIIIGTFSLVLAIAARWVGLGWFLADRARRRSAIAFLGAGAALAAVATIVLVSGGLNDTWFALAASTPLAVISAAGIAQAVARITGRQGWSPGARVAWAILAALPCGLIVALLWRQAPGSSPTLRWLAPAAAFLLAAALGWLLAGHAGSRRRRDAVVLAAVTITVMAAGGRILGVLAPQFGVNSSTLSRNEFSLTSPVAESLDGQWPMVISAMQVEAGRWLRNASGVHELVATNATYGPLVPALTARQTYLSAFRYQVPYGRERLIGEAVARERASWGFIDRPSAATVGPLCSARIAWLWVDPSRTKRSDWAPFASVAFKTDDVTVLRLERSAC